MDSPVEDSALAQDFLVDKSNVGETADFAPEHATEDDNAAEEEAVEEDTAEEDTPEEEDDPSPEEPANHELVITQKDASTAAFYSGFFKGARSALDGIVLFFSSPKLRKIAWEVAKPLRNAEIAYVSAGLFIFLVLRNPSAGLTEFLWTLSSWGKVVTMITALILDKGFDANSTMFFASIRERRPSFADALEKTPTVRTSIRERVSTFKRVAKLTAFKAAGSLIRAVIPGGQYIAIPALKFVSLRPVLGNVVAAAVAAVDIIPTQMLDSSHFDDALVSFGEAVVDADDFGSDITRKYARRLQPEVRDYFSDRYRGYLAGCGFVYSLLSSVPFVGIPMLLIGECGAACLILDIVERNLEKGRRVPLPCEEQIAIDRASAVTKKDA